LTGKTDIHESKKKGFEHIELPAKLLDYLIRSNKSNINQSTDQRALPPTAMSNCPRSGKMRRRNDMNDNDCAICQKEE